MHDTLLVRLIVLLLLLAKWAMQLWLERLNQRHVLAHADAVPEGFKAFIDENTYAKSVAYTLAKGRLRQVEDTFDLGFLLVVLFSGALPWALDFFNGWLGHSTW